MKLSHGDSVIVISGKDKGKKGTIMRVLHAQNRVIVSGINMATKHVKKTPQSEGKKVRLEVSIHASNVQMIDPKSGKATRIGYQIDEKTGKKVRIAKKTGTVLSRVKVEAKATEKKVASKDDKATPKKKGFWKGGGFASTTSADGAKAEAGPAQATIQTRSAGRGS